MTISRGVSPKKGGKKRKQFPPFWRKPLPKRVVMRPHPVTKVPVQWYDGRIGVDVGGVMLSRFSGKGKPLPLEEYVASPLYEGVRDAFRLLILLFGAERVFIIKNDSNGTLSQESRDTLKKHKFFDETGFLDRNWLITKKRINKGQHCHRHRIDFLVDDKAEVGRYLPRRTFFFWFGEEPQEDPEHERAVVNRARKGHLRYMQVKDWNRLTEEIFRFFPPLEVVMAGRPETENDEVKRLLAALRKVGRQ